jgi:integrase
MRRLRLRRPERKTNGNWQLRFEDAHRRIRYRTFRTKAAAEAFAKSLVDGVDTGRRFHELVDEWRASHLAHGLRASTTKDYRQSLKRLGEFFGQRELRTITSGDLERCRNELVEKVRTERTAKFGRVLAAASKTKLVELKARESELRAEIARGGVRAAAKMIGCARTLWKFAVARGYAVRNIAENVRKPQVERAVESGMIDSNVLTPVEIERMLAHAPKEHRCAVKFLFWTGVRFGELRGLMWTDMDAASSRVIIRRQRSGVTGTLTAPKTSAGTRWIDLSADLVRELKAHRLSTSGEFMFPIDERNWRARVWHPSLRRAGLRAIRIHDARHTHASMLLALGADIPAVSRRLGHASPQVTLTTYAHAVARRGIAPLGEQLAAFMRRETVGCVSVAPTTAPTTATEDQHTEVVEDVVELTMARGGIEPPTRGFSVRCSTN